ncbi:ATP-binding protein [Roseimarinus sediminis]|jgi:anti-sigma regulatory factor (Ser/Thr protein kinase)|uniref:ATP-binding protein n=1 Tax=Roseimarinus sediminis TaxID=1610899 RepID=UPI003D22F24D
MALTLKYKVDGGDFSKAGYASSQVKKNLKQLSIDTRLIKNIVVALYEAEVNIVAHAHHGQITVIITTLEVKMIVSDEGPGIEDVEQAMQEGFSTASDKVRQMGFGAGMGLPNIRRNVDELSIDTLVGKGTTLTMIKKIANAS